MELKKVICETPEQFHEEVEKWQNKGAAPIIRGRQLIAYGEPVAELATTRGGARPGSGRPSKGDRVTITVRLSKEAADIVRKQDNQSEYIDSLILKYKPK